MLVPETSKAAPQSDSQSDYLNEGEFLMAMSVTYLTMNGMIVHENRGGVQRDYVSDTLGSTAALVDSMQTITDRWEYWPYGEVSQRTGTNTTPFTFVGMLGYFRDVLDKLFYVRARYLRPNLARWLTVDPLWPGQPAYSYTSSPTLSIDPSGTQFGHNYGNWCGYGTHGPGKPKDAIDACCKQHDECVPTWCDSWKWVWCACEMCNCARSALAFGCGDDADCFDEALKVAAFFCIQCPTSHLPPYFGHIPPFDPPKPNPGPRPTPRPADPCVADCWIDCVQNRRQQDCLRYCLTKCSKPKLLPGETIWV